MDTIINNIENDFESYNKLINFYELNKEKTFTSINLQINGWFNANTCSMLAIEWAIKDRNTTKDGVSGGIGLALLHEFIQKNKGKIQIISNDGFWELNTNKIIKSSFKNEFPGTMVNIVVKTNDKNSYMLYDEIPDDIF